MAVGQPRPDLAAHTRAVRATFPEVVDELRALLGARLVAYLGAVGETRAVHQWAAGERRPGEAVQARLRLALQVALMIADADGAAIARSWLQGLNPQLDDRSPARMLREGDVQEVGPAVVAAARASGADFLVTLGGASVGEHDLVQSALAREGMELGFWRVALRPGKPLMHGRLGPMLLLGLPGNPVSSIVCGILFMVPAIRAMLGDPDAGADPSEAAMLGTELPANDARQDYMRATLRRGSGGPPVATAHPVQDSSMLSVLAGCDALIVRPPHAPAARVGEPCRIVRLDTRL
jgi:hypothetical protein